MKNLPACRPSVGWILLAALWSCCALAQTEAADEANTTGAALAPAQRAVLDRVNHYRRLAGVAPVAPEPRLAQAAQAHSEYMSATGTLAHVQALPENPSFTGETVEDRLQAVGYAADRASEVVGVASAVKPEVTVDNLVSAIYHRFLILDAAMTHAGSGVAAAREGERKLVYVTVKFAAETPPAAPAVRLTVYPAEGQTGLPTGFDPATEVPNPMPGHEVVGEPVSVQADASATLSVDAFRLFALGADEDARPLEAQLLTQTSDANTPEWAAALIPLEPLAPATSYRAEFQGTVDGKPVSRTWEFTTAAEQPVTIRFAQATVPSGGRQTVRLRNLDASRGAFHVCYGPADLVREAVQETNERLALTVGRCDTGTACEVTVSVAYEPGCADPVAQGRFEVQG